MEVARKGGVAWILALEQSAEECLYTLQAMRILPNDGSIAVAANTSSAFEVLQQSRIEKILGNGLPTDPKIGALIFVKAEKSSYEKFLAALLEPAEWMQAYPLRLIVVDPSQRYQQGPIAGPWQVHRFPRRYKFSNRSKSLARTYG